MLNRDTGTPHTDRGSHAGPATRRDRATGQFHPVRYVMLLSISVKVLGLLALLVWWNPLAGLGWLRGFLAGLLAVVIVVQADRLRRIWR
ncbi:MAG: hypothetical protein RMJ43_03665 [Chloroherpetonaceae bacterium]|nr:hypothetical protein [Chthonomonadaceae bacterium]MDW8206909.1 hypothetical protein [Chloroherpetonaceae bacterium]